MWTFVGLTQNSFVCLECKLVDPRRMDTVGRLAHRRRYRFHGSNRLVVAHNCNFWWYSGHQRPIRAGTDSATRHRGSIKCTADKHAAPTANGMPHFADIGSTGPGRAQHTVRFRHRIICHSRTRHVQPGHYCMPSSGRTNENREQIHSDDRNMGSRCIAHWRTSRWRAPTAKSQDSCTSLLSPASVHFEIGFVFTSSKRSKLDCAVNQRYAFIYTFIGHLISRDQQKLNFSLCAIFTRACANRPISRCADMREPTENDKTDSDETMDDEQRTFQVRKLMSDAKLSLEHISFRLQT